MEKPGAPSGSWYVKMISLQCEGVKGAEDILPRFVKRFPETWLIRGEALQTRQRGPALGDSGKGAERHPSRLDSIQCADKQLYDHVGRAQGGEKEHINAREEGDGGDRAHHEICLDMDPPVSQALYLFGKRPEMVGEYVLTLPETDSDLPESVEKMAEYVEQAAFGGGDLKKQGPAGLLGDLHDQQDQPEDQQEDHPRGPGEAEDPQPEDEQGLQLVKSASSHPMLMSDGREKSPGPVYRTKKMIGPKKPGFFLRLGGRPVWEKAEFLAPSRFFVLHTGLGNFPNPQHCREFVISNSHP